MSESSLSREKALDKIQKLLRLAKSNQPHEAAAAMRQAQKMMAAYAISEEDVIVKEVHSEQFVSRSPWRKKLPLDYTLMASICRAAFGVECVIEPSYTSRDAKLAFRYFGPEMQTKLAVHTHAVLERSIWATWNEYRQDKPWLDNQRGARMGFWVGWLKEVRSKVVDFYGVKKKEQEEARAAGNNAIVPVDEGEAQRAKSQQAIAKHYGSNLQDTVSNSMALNGATHGAGREAAKDFQLHRPMEGERQRQLGN